MLTPPAKCPGTLIRLVRSCMVGGAAGVTLLLGSSALRQTSTESFTASIPPHVYAEHAARVQALLPAHSALPPLLDLSKPNEGGPGAGQKWEDRFTGSMGVRPIDDPGVHSLDEATSISTTTTEYAGPLMPLPARNCSFVVVAKPINANAHFAYNHRFVYSIFDVEISQVFKGQNKLDIREGSKIAVAQLGGSIRFPSGHEAAFLEANDGFLESGKQYLLFLWKPVPSSNVYMVDEAYLLQEGSVFPISLGSHESPYIGMSIEKFITKVKALIAKNVNGM